MFWEVSSVLPHDRSHHPDKAPEPTKLYRGCEVPYLICDIPFSNFGRVTRIKKWEFPSGQMRAYDLDLRIVYGPQVDRGIQSEQTDDAGSDQ